jgi:hypothetical protein
MENEQCEIVSDELFRLSRASNTMTVCVLHSTKSTGNARGHIGTYLEDKSETMIKVEIDENDRLVSHVTCQLARNKPFENFSITMNEDTGYYEKLDEMFVKKEGKKRIDFDIIRMTEIASLINNPITFKMLTNLIQGKADDFNVISDDCASEWVRKAEDNRIILYDKDKKTYTNARKQVNKYDDPTVELPF